MTRIPLVAVLLAGSSLAAQTPAHDPSGRLRQVLPADVAERVLARVAEVLAHQLPAQALQQRALMLAGKGVAPDEIERDVSEHAERLAHAELVLERARGRRPGGDEIEAGAEALRHGVDGAAVSALAKAAPSGRSLAVPLYIISSLASRGLPSDEALARVRDRLADHASDVELEHLPDQVPDHGGHGLEHASGPAKPPHGEGGLHPGATHGHGAHGGPPHGVPANPGHRGHPVHPDKPKPGHP